MELNFSLGFSRNKRSQESYNPVKNTASSQLVEDIASAIGSISSKLLTFSDKLAFSLALSISEIYTPINICASRVASVRYELQDLSGKQIEPKGNLAELLNNPNALNSLNDIMYQLTFSGMADGNKWLYTRILSDNKDAKPTPDNVKSIWVLQPNLINIVEKRDVNNILAINSKSDIIDYLKYGSAKEQIYPNTIHHYNNFMEKRDGSLFISKSPLNASEKSINNLLAVYSARLNVYNNNGMAGLLYKKASGDSNDPDDVMSQSKNPGTRDDILKDINERNGVVGNKNIWGISSIELGFLKTLATISELQPFEETREDAMQIASIFQVDKDLLNNKDNSNYENKRNAELNLWQNFIKKECIENAKILTNSLNLTKSKIVPIFDDIEILKENAKILAETTGLKIDNILKVYDKDSKEFADEIEKLK